MVKKYMEDLVKLSPNKRMLSKSLNFVMLTITKFTTLSIYRDGFFCK